MPSTKKFSWLKQNWGFTIFAIDVVASLLWLLRGRTGHYVNFTEPALYLWRGADPYGITFPNSPGGFFYAPGCALYFYGLFAFLPPLVGQLFYMSLCVVCFWFGYQLFLRTIKPRLGFDIATSPYRHLLWLMAGSEILGGIIAVKIDVLIVGVLFWLAANLMRNKHVLVSLFVVGIVTSWKLHPLLVVGLMGIVMLLDRRWLAPLVYGAGVVFGLISPVFVLPWSFVVQVTKHWLSSLHEFVTVSWLAGIFQHIYGFFARTFHFHIPAEVGNRITLVFGALAVIYLVIVYKRFQNASGRKNASIFGYGLALAVGSGYVALFSQLVQSNSYIVYFPLPVIFAALVTNLNWNRRTVYSLLIATYLIVSIAYSDFCPRPLYRILYYTGIKPLGVLLLLLATVIAAWQLSVKRAIPRTP